MITVVTPSIRPDMLEIVFKCLKRQSYEDWEWLVASPEDYGFGKFIQEPPKGNDFYALNKAWNAAFRTAHGKLIVSIVDGLWFPPDTLEKLWTHYQNNPKSCVTCVGNQYDQMENGKPEHMVWRDPRIRTDFGSFYEVSPSEMELCIASLPLQAIKEVGGIDEEFDKYAALSEKEMCYRMDKLGYKFFIDQTIEYRAIKHPRIGGNEKWDTAYEAGCVYYQNCLREISDGKRLKLDYLMS
jgi:hypothetical protein